MVSSIRTCSELSVSCELVLEEDLPILPDLVESVRTKDAGALATTRALGLANRVSADRDFEHVPEHRTPREFLVALGEKPRAGEE